MRSGCCSFARLQSWGAGDLRRISQQKIAFLEKNFRATVYYVKSPELEISSGIIRDRIRAGKSARYLLPDAVLAFITEHGMYKE